METNEQLKTLEGTKTFVKDLSEECRKNLLEVIETTGINEKENYDLTKPD
jgi:hypothetical protein